MSKENSPSPYSLTLSTIFQQLHTFYGPQRWWPTRNSARWEIMMGAVLTQHTTWTNVERALNNAFSLWGEDGLSRPEMVLEAASDTLVEIFRPAGFYTVKPRKLQNLARFVLESGGIEALLASQETTQSLRGRLLTLWGIGPETADAILLYALDRPVFVADAYALRLASRWGLLEPTATYEEVQALFMDNLPHDIALFNEFHALIVAHGKAICRPRPRCEACPLNMFLTLDETKTWRCPKCNVENRE